MKFGLSDLVLESIIAPMRKYKNIEKAVIYGSRARGNFREHSDIDIAVFAPSMSSADFAKLWNEIDSSPAIFGLDILKFEDIADKDLKDSILRDGVRIYP